LGASGFVLMVNVFKISPLLVEIVYVALCPGFGLASFTSPPVRLEVLVFLVVLLNVVKTKS